MVSASNIGAASVPMLVPAVPDAPTLCGPSCGEFATTNRLASSSGTAGRSSMLPQYRHLIAAFWMSSAQNGHFFIGSPWRIQSWIS